MQIRDFYISVLEKRAEKDEEPLGTDNSAAAYDGLEENQEEQKKDLSDLFEHTTDAKKDIALVRKNFPAAKKAKDTTSSSSLLKIATHRAFFNGLRDTDMMKSAGPEYLRAAFQGFEEELGKIASLLVGTGSSAIPGKLAKHLKNPIKQLAKPPKKAPAFK